MPKPWQRAEHGCCGDKLQSPCEGAKAKQCLCPTITETQSGALGQSMDQESTQVIFIRNQQVIKIQTQSSGSMLRDTLG